MLIVLIINTINKTETKMKTLIKYVTVIASVIAVIVAWNMMSLSIKAQRETTKIQGQCIAKYIATGHERSEIELTPTSCKLK